MYNYHAGDDGILGKGGSSFTAKAFTPEPVVLRFMFGLLPFERYESTSGEDMENVA